MKNRSTCVAVLVTLGCATTLAAQFAGGSAADSDIHALADQYAGAYSRGDARSLARFFEPDGMLIDADSQTTTRGKPAIEAMYANWFAGAGGGGRMSVTVKQIRKLGTEVAQVEAAYDILSPGGFVAAGSNERGALVVTLGRRGGTWSIVTAVILPPAPGWW